MGAGGQLRTVTERFLSRPALEVAPELLGGVLRVRSPQGTVGIRLTEVEAYEGTDDPASHGWRGPTPRTKVMFGPPGRLYVYFTYGMHWCANVVCMPEGRSSAVLLRAGEVVEGEELARIRRPAAKKDVDLARGPARLASALGLSKVDDGLLLCGRGARGSIDLPPSTSDLRVATGPRVGITRAVERPWRFWLEGEATVSAFRTGGRKRTTARVVEN